VREYLEFIFKSLNCSIFSTINRSISSGSIKFSGSSYSLGFIQTTDLHPASIAGIISAVKLSPTVSVFSGLVSTLEYACSQLSVFLSSVIGTDT
jgi:hypothetical protein